MIAYLPFGDYSCDGHGQCDYELIWIDSIVELINAQENIKNKYGENFFNTFAADYEDNSLKEVHLKALIDTNYPIERLIEKDECNDWSNCKSIADMLTIDPQPYLSIEFIKDAYIWIMNSFSANIKLTAEKIPVLGWDVANALEIVGYGCFE